MWKSFRFATVPQLLAFLLVVSPANGGSLQHRDLERKLGEITAGFAARVGVCAVDRTGSSCVNGEETFSLQSVMKLLVSLAVLDAADRRELRLSDQVVVHREDLSLYVQPLADLVGQQGYRTTIADLIRRAIVDSDSAAADIMIRRLGGPLLVQRFLDRKGIRGVRIDRDERHLQTEIVGLTWRPEYVDAAKLEKAIAAVPAQQRDEDYRKYQMDVRDTATPLGMAMLLQRLASGELLSPASTRYALTTMAQTATFPDRLKAGTPRGWTCMHKTGTSGSWNGVTAATNDVGILRAPDGTYVSVAVFIADTREPPEARSRVMREIAAATAASYR